VKQRELLREVLRELGLSGKKEEQVTLRGLLPDAGEAREELGDAAELGREH
jgi:hypothetical protein